MAPLDDGIGTETLKEDTLAVTVDGKPGVLAFTGEEFIVHGPPSGAVAGQSKNPTKLRTALKNVLYAELLPNGDLHVSTLAKKKKAHVLVGIVGRPTGVDAPVVSEWISRLMQRARCNPGKRLRVVVNPFGGQGTGRAIYEKRVRPVFEAARCVVTVTYTTHSGHAEELARDLDISSLDALVVVSGDGVVHEVFNGFAVRPDARKAFRVPVVHVPAGSGNAFSVSIMGNEDCADIALAALNVIKGSPMKLDMTSVTQGDVRRVSFLSQAIGLMADLDLGTEHLRWMGGRRFIYGFFKGLIIPKACPIKVWLKIAESDKQKMADASRVDGKPLNEDTEETDGEEGEGLPPLKFRDSDSEGWFQFPEPMNSLYAGMMPFVARDVMQFPVAKPDDGLIDVVIQSMCKNMRSVMLQGLDGADKGKQYWLPSQHYYKVQAYRVTPLARKGHLAIDGEAWPYQPFQVEVHPRLATTLSMYGRFNAEF